MASTVEGAGVPLRYEEAGRGPAVLLVHGIADDAGGWAEVARALEDTARVVAYDRRGYGGSGAPEPYERSTVEEQAEDAAALLHALGAAPALLCGCDLGALICLDLCKRHADLVAGAVLIEPSLFPLVPAATEALAVEREALEQALREGDPALAVQRYLLAKGHDPESERVHRARASPRAFFADYGAVATWPVSRGELRALEVPAAVLAAPGAPAHVREAADALASLLPAAERYEGDDPLPALRQLLADRQVEHHRPA